MCACRVNACCPQSSGTRATDGCEPLREPNSGPLQELSPRPNACFILQVLHTLDYTNTAVQGLVLKLSLGELGPVHTPLFPGVVSTNPHILSHLAIFGH